MIDHILEFLPCATPQAWLDEALVQLDILLIDHANCEKKAAATAMNLMYRHTRQTELLKKMSQLAREELLHFQQVVEIMEERNIEYKRISPSRYASALRDMISAEENQQFIDTLIVGAIIEARSCERFAALIPLLDEDLAKFYGSLLKSESRHYQDYLSLAALYSEQNIDSRLGAFLEKEAELITSPDEVFRFHSGVPPAQDPVAN